jgi:hypothetical protein
MKIFCLFACISILFTNRCFGQDRNIVEPELKKTELHQSSIGKIFFTEKSFSYETISEANLLKTYKLTNKSNLFFVAYFDNSLTNYKHQILPKYSGDTLFKFGNYQFTIYIDKVIFCPGLHKGKVKTRKPI